MNVKTMESVTQSKDPMGYTARALHAVGVPFQWYGSGGGYEHWIIGIEGEDWYDKPHLITGGNENGCLIVEADGGDDSYQFSIALHEGFGYEWEKLTPEEMHTIAKQIAYTAKGWLLGKASEELSNGKLLECSVCKRLRNPEEMTRLEDFFERYECNPCQEAQEKKSCREMILELQTAIDNIKREATK